MSFYGRTDGFSTRRSSSLIKDQFRKTHLHSETDLTHSTNGIAHPVNGAAYSNGAVHSANGAEEPARKAPLNIRQKIQGVPLRGIAIFFGTLLIVGAYRRGDLAALWVLGWASFFAGKIIIQVKKKVEQKSAQR